MLGGEGTGRVAKHVQPSTTVCIPAAPGPDSKPQAHTKSLMGQSMQTSTKQFMMALPDLCLTCLDYPLISKATVQLCWPLEHLCRNASRWFGLPQVVVLSFKASPGPKHTKVVSKSATGWGQKRSHKAALGERCRVAWRQTPGCFVCVL